MSAGSTALVSSLSIAIDLGLHIYNFGVPMPTSGEFFASEKGLAFAGTTSGIIATSIASGVTSGTLNTVVTQETTEYQKSLTKTVIASSVINTKMLTQAGVGVGYMLIAGRPMTELNDWAVKQFIPSLVLHGLLAGTIPYMM